MRVRVRGGASLDQARPKAAKVKVSPKPRKLFRVYWSVARGPQNVFWLVLKDVGKPTGGSPGSAIVPLGMLPPRLQYFEAEAVFDVVLPALVQLDQNVFFGFGWLSGDGGRSQPIKNSQAV